MLLPCASSTPPCVRLPLTRFTTSAPVTVDADRFRSFASVMLASPVTFNASFARSFDSLSSVTLPAVTLVSPVTVTLSPAATVIRSSGYSDEAPGPGPFLAKPYTIDDLEGILTRVLTGGSR